MLAHNFRNDILTFVIHEKTVTTFLNTDTRIIYAWYEVVACDSVVTTDTD